MGPEPECEASSTKGSLCCPKPEDQDKSKPLVESWGLITRMTSCRSKSRVRGKIWTEPTKCLALCPLSFRLSLSLWAKDYSPHVSLSVLPHPLDSIHDVGFPVRTLALPHTVPSSLPLAAKKCWNNPTPGTLLSRSQACGQQSHPICPRPFWGVENRTQIVGMRISLKVPLARHSLSSSPFPVLATLATLGRHISQCKFPNWYSG